MGVLAMRRRGIALTLTIFAACVSLAAAATVTIHEWDLPKPRSLPHDPAVGPDGALWYTAMLANTIGRLDPQSGKIREYPLKTPGSGPHGLVADREGNIWFTANYKGYVGRLDPRTGEVIEYPMPDPAALDPHSLVFDAGGTLWFTVQAGNFVGKLEPRTGKVILKRPSTEDARPYGIVVDGKGVPFFCEFGANKIGRIDPATMTITEYLLPKDTRPRRIAVADDLLYYTDYASGHLGRLDPKSGRVFEWLSPGGRRSKPYGIAVLPDGTVWYSESGVQPNTLVRFDPRTKLFVFWPILSGGGVIRNMTATSHGEIYIACSGVNKIGIVRIE